MEAKQTALTMASTKARLEGRWDEPEAAEAAVVLCHPHPNQGGTMNAPLMHRVTKELVANHYAVLRFNFRGVGDSTGEWNGGEAEVDDVAAAVAAAQREYPDAVKLAGWSFGAAIALIWQARNSSVVAYAGIALPVDSQHTPPLPKPEELATARRLFIQGDRDQFTTVDEARRYAESVGGHFELLAGSDHFFYFREERVGRLIATFFGAAG